MNSKELAEKIATIGWEKKGNDIVLLDVRQLTDITDFFVIMSGESEPHVKALSNYVEEKLSSNGEKVWHREGYQNLNWVLLDYIEVVVHIFREQTRQFYGIEKLWGDANIIRVEENAENRIVFTENH